MSLKLDVGCGIFSSGDVNCDLYVNDVGNRTGKTSKLTGKISAENFVLCDVQHLPFRTGSFSEVYSSHVIEHVPEPFLMLREMVRVSNDKVTVICPHGLGERVTGAKNSFHLWFFKKSWFYHAGRVLGVRAVTVSYSLSCGIPFEFFALLRLPTELKTEMRK